MNAKTENYGFGKSWSDPYIDEYEGREPRMSDYHKHDYYELSLILSGEVRVLMPGVSSVGSCARVVFSPPGTPHYVTCTGSALYKRINIVFSKNLLSDERAEGGVTEVDSATAEKLFGIIKGIELEEGREGKKILLSYLLYKVRELSGRNVGVGAPSYVTDALLYIKEHYAEKFTAEELAHAVGVGRTTLMTGFKAHVGMSLGEYITRYRTGIAARLIGGGESCAKAAELSGFSDGAGMIRAFKREFGLTPGKYAKFLLEGKRS